MDYYGEKNQNTSHSEWETNYSHFLRGITVKVVGLPLHWTYASMLQHPIQFGYNIKTTGFWLAYREEDPL